MNLRELQQFLDFGNWLHHFVKDYSVVVKPLTSLTGKADWKWEAEQQGAYEELKRHLCSSPVLVIPNDKSTFHVEANASNYAIRGVLLQEQDRKWRPVAYRSETFIEAKHNYEIYNKEMLAIVQALRDWHQYLLEAQRCFEVWSDHVNLIYFKSPQKLNYRQAR